MRKIAVVVVAMVALLAVSSAALGVKPKAGTKYKGATGLDCIWAGRVSFKVSASGKAIKRFHTNGACVACKQQPGLQMHTRRATLTMGSIPLSKGTFTRTKTYVLRTIPGGGVQGSHSIKPKKMHVVVTVSGKFKNVSGKVQESGFIVTHELRKVNGKLTKHGCANVVQSYFTSPA